MAKDKAKRLFGEILEKDSARTIGLKDMRAEPGEGLRKEVLPPRPWEHPLTCSQEDKLTPPHIELRERTLRLLYQPSKHSVFGFKHKRQGGVRGIIGPPWG